MPRTYTTAQLVKVYKWAKSNPEGRIDLGRECWTNQYLSSDEWLRWFRNCLDEKLSSHLAGRTGRKWDYDWWCEMRRAADQLNHPGLIIDWLPPDLQDRFAHRLRQNSER